MPKISLKEISDYTLQKLWKTMFLITMGILFATSISAFLNHDMISSIQNDLPFVFRIILAEIIGFIAPGPRFIIYPIMDELISFGVRGYILVALISGHVIIEPVTMFMEFGFFGISFPMKRIAVALVTIFGIAFFAWFLTIKMGMSLLS
ncbi:MAG: hypothetical protein ACLFSQ_05875 [Candidatus Zixiibacteriota bacterium]